MDLINLNLYQVPFSVLAAKAQTLYHGFKKNKIEYSAPKPALEIFLKHIKTLNKAIAARGTVSNHGSSTDYTALVLAAEQVREDIRQLSFYALNTKPDNSSSWIGLGFVLKHYSRTSKPLGMVENFRHFISREIPPQHVKIAWSKPLGVTVRDVRIYLVQRNNNPDYPGVIPCRENIIGLPTATKFIDEHPLIGENYYWVTPINGAGVGVTSQAVRVVNGMYSSKDNSD
jgi:hypothetical protein